MHKCTNSLSNSDTDQSSLTPLTAEPVLTERVAKFHKWVANLHMVESKCAGVGGILNFVLYSLLLAPHESWSEPWPCSPVTAHSHRDSNSLVTKLFKDTLWELMFVRVTYHELWIFCQAQVTTNSKISCDQISSLDLTKSETWPNSLQNFHLCQKYVRSKVKKSKFWVVKKFLVSTKNSYDQVGTSDHTCGWCSQVTYIFCWLKIILS